jgi:hypothetical protein
VFLASLKNVDPSLHSNTQFDGYRLLYESPTSVKLLRRGQVIGEAPQRNGLAFFDPDVAHEGVRENVEYIFEDRAGAARRRSNEAEE